LKAEIHPIDDHILRTLTKDARIDLNDLAKECNLTSSAVLKRIRKLKNSAIIVGTQLDLKRGTLGYPEVATLGIAAENSKVDDITQKVRTIPNVVVCAKSIGRYNLFAHVFAKDLIELDYVTHLIKNIKGIKLISINIHIGEEFLPTLDNDERKKNKDMETIYTVDETDLKIINELLIDAQKPFSQIGRKLGISHETVRQRYERLRKKGIIRGCSIIVDRSKLGFQGSAFFLISCPQDHSKESTINALMNLQSFDNITKVIGGGFDIFARLASACFCGCGV